jgi:hypothetical protein
VIRAADSLYCARLFAFHDGGPPPGACFPMPFLRRLLLLLCFAVSVLPADAASARGEPHWKSTEKDIPDQYASFPLPLTEYADRKADAPAQTLGERLEARSGADPFNLAATIIFIGAILHTFAAGLFQSWSHRVEKRHQERLKAEGRTPDRSRYKEAGEIVSFKAKLLHFFGEVEVVFALWAVPLLLCAWWFHGWENVQRFVGLDCNFTEPFFVVVIMVISASRPVVRFAEQCLSLAAIRLGKGTPAAWWLSVLSVAPLLGSLITEPAAMTISAMLLARKFYELRPRRVFAYATLGLLFVNISVGGVLTNFAAPPVLMVAAKWNWSSAFMFTHFGWHAILSIVVCNALYFLIFRGEFKKLGDPLDKTRDGASPVHWNDRNEPVPHWITAAHLAFLGWSVFTLHFPPLFIGGFLFFLAFVQSTEHHQNPVSLRAPLLVGLFLAGLVIHGRCQAWWLEPVLSGGLNEWQLMLGSTVLTAFNDNALITYLASQVPGLSDPLKFAVMSGAIAGGGLTVIANAPNPAGQGILKSYFAGSVNPFGLLLAALIPTVIVVCAFVLL